jgi:hypothetical protein
VELPTLNACAIEKFTNPLLPHIVNTPSTTMDPMVDPRITIANLVAQ